MDGVLTIPDEPAIASIDAETMPDDSLPAPEPNDEHSVTPDGSQPIEIVPMRVVEAILFAADSPLPPNKIASILGVGDAREVRKHIAALNELYEAAGNAFRIEEIAGGFRMMTLPPFNRWLTKLLRARQETKLTGASMETLAIVAYKQPCTRADIEAVRGVAAGDMLNRLREMNLIKIVGRAEDLGRPLLYGTTKRFLEVFGLAGLEDLPQVDALRGGAVAQPNETVRPAETLDAGESVDASAASELKIADADVNVRDFDMHEGGVAGSASAEASPMDAANETPLSEQLSDEQLPREASADLTRQQGHAGEHPPPKAVVTPRPRRNRKPKDEPPSE